VSGGLKNVTAVERFAPKVHCTSIVGTFEALLKPSASDQATKAPAAAPRLLASQPIRAAAW